MNRVRLLAAAGAVVLGSYASAPLAASAEVDQDGWHLGGEAVDVDTASGTITVSGTLTPPDAPPFSQNRVTRIDVTATRVADGVTACPATVSGQQTFAGNDDDPYWDSWALGDPPFDYADNGGTAFSIDITPDCNGMYTVSLTAVADAVGGSNNDDTTLPNPDDDPPMELDGTHPVDVAPPAINGVVAVLGADRHVTVAWQPPAGWGQATSCTAAVSGSPPDFTGYVLDRTVDGTTTRIATVPAGTQCATDVLTADAALGSYRYDVYAVRVGSAGNVLSALAGSTVVTVGPPTSDSPAPTTEVRPPQGTVRVGGNVSSGGVASGTVPPTAPDGTFEPTLDYDDEEPGELAADVPDDAETFLDFVPSPGAGILVPFAIAECLAVWALHLRYLARRADDGI